MKDKYVLDSSIWIELERKNTSVLQLVQPWIDKNEICLIDVITAELLRGVKSRKDYQKLQKAFDDFPCFGTSWKKVADLAFRCAKNGFHPPLIDLYIAQCTHENKKTLVTRDKHFQCIAKTQPFHFIFIA